MQFALNLAFLSHRAIFDYFIIIIITLVFMLGVHSIYMWGSTNFGNPARGIATIFDHKFPYRPGWVWVYVSIYPIIIITSYTAKDMQQFTYGLFSYFMLIIILMVFYLLFPVRMPSSWHRYKGNKASERLLRLIRKGDTSRNCFPSLHVSAATLTAYHVMFNLPQFGLWPLAYPILISLSVLFTKQHFIMDAPPGFIVGWVVFGVYKYVYINSLF